jgi:glycosyltransferase involved in cell wall biosynthesis
MVIQSFLPVLGGAQRQVDLLGPLLAERGVGLTAVTRRPPGTPARESRPGLEVRRMPGPDQGPLGSISYTAAGTLELARLRPDVIHVHDLLSPATIGLLSATVLRAPVVAKVLSTGPGGDLDRLLTKPLGSARLKAMAKRFSAFLCLSDDVAEELQRHGVPEGRLKRIPNGVDTERFRPAAEDERAAGRARLGIDPGGLLALYAGRFDPVKRLDLLIDAIADSPSVRLLLVGEGGEERSIRDRIAAKGLADRVDLMPKTEDPTPFYRAADLYVSTSSTEGMSNSVLEAMAVGLPIVTVRASGMSELVTADTGLLVDEADPASFAAALEALAEDPALRRRLGGGARSLVEARYSLASVATMLRGLYDEVTGGGGESTS